MVDVSNNITLTESVSLNVTCRVYSIDQCTGGTPSASGTIGAPFDSPAAFDDSLSTYWYEGSASFPQWIQYDFGSNKRIACVKIYADQDGGGDIRLKDFNVYYSDNGSDWNDAGSFQCPNSGEQWYEFKFIPVGAYRYWRLHITSTWDGDSSSIHEIEMLACLDTVDLEVFDSFTLTDSSTVQPLGPAEINVSDSLSLAETANTVPSFHEVEVSDSISVAESSKLLTEGIITEDIEFTDYVDAFNLTDTLTDGFTLADFVDRDFEAFRGLQDDFTLSDEVDAFNWSKWFRDNADRSVKVYYLTITGAADSTTDIEIPMESFQARKRTGYATYLSVVVPLEYSSQISARSNGQIVVDMAYKIGSEISLREEIVRADIDDIRIDEGSRHGSISIFGYRTDTFASQAVTVTEPIYRNVTDGKLRYRFATPDPYLNPGDVATVGSDQFTVASISYVVSARQQSMEVAEA